MYSYLHETTWVSFQLDPTSEWLIGEYDSKVPDPIWFESYEYRIRKTDLIQAYPI
jgi:hypothetical protein